MLCKFWQDNGLKVIPTVPFAGFEFNHYALIGLEKDSVVAVSTVERLSPYMIKKYGQIILAADPNVKW